MRALPFLLPGTEIGVKDLIKTSRIAKGYTQHQLADLCGVTRQAVYYWESGAREPSVAMMFRLAKILDIDLGEIADAYDK
jgi:transcriptional regulator with XRE-family HTH domain